MGIISGASFSEVALGKPFVKTNYEKERVKLFLRLTSWNFNFVGHVVKLLNFINFFKPGVAKKPLIG